MLPAGHTSSSSTPTYSMKSGDTLHWRCTVLAGVRDKLVWTLNGTELPLVDAEHQQVSYYPPTHHGCVLQYVRHAWPEHAL